MDDQVRYAGIYREQSTMSWSATGKRSVRSTTVKFFLEIIIIEAEADFMILHFMILHEIYEEQKLQTGFSTINSCVLRF